MAGRLGWKRHGRRREEPNESGVTGAVHCLRSVLNSLALNCFRGRAVANSNSLPYTRKFEEEPLEDGLVAVQACESLYLSRTTIAANG